MERTEVALLGAVIGAGAALIASILTNLIAARNHRRTIEEGRRLARSREISDRCARVFAQLFEIQHAIEWVAAHAAVDAESITVPMLEDYDATGHRVYGSVQSDLTLLAAASLPLWRTVNPQAEAVFDLEAEVAPLILRCRRSGRLDQASLEGLERAAEKSQVVRRRLSDELAVALASRFEGLGWRFRGDW